MASAPTGLPRTPISEQVESLREAAELSALDLEGIPAPETIEGEAAQTLEEFAAALTQIAEGTTDPVKVAHDALRLDKPLKPFGDANDTIRGLLKPR